MRKKFLSAILICLFALANTHVFAQTSLKIAVVDTDKAFQESIWGKKAVEEFEKETEKWQKRGEELDAEIAKLEEELAKQRNFLEDKEEEQRLQNEIDEKRMEGQNFIQEGRSKLGEKRQELLEPISEEINSLIKKIAMEESYDIVLEKQLIVLYLNPELDITSRVVAMLDEVYKQRISSKSKESEKPASEENTEKKD
jgi:Skp family chaperone for outer membrane proteins